MQNQDMRYFLYARKSTDEPDRQILSIEGQLAELREYAKKENLIIVKDFIESKTAKEPGREIFNDMIASIEDGKAQGIIAWHPDRLARNSIDGGRIIYLVDTTKITALKFPTFWFDPTPQGKFMLSIAFGQSKYYVDNLSENIRRGFRQKLRNGIWPCCAPLGYINDKNTRTIFPDKDRAVFIRKTFELYSSGDYPLAEVRRIMNEVGLKGRHTALSVSNYQYMLKNPVYYGLIRYKGELYEGKHEPIITKALFDLCQAVMLRKSKPKGPRLKPYTYRGVFHCKECGCFITTETQKNHNYLRCTKRKGPCAEPYVREELITAQIKGELKSVSLPPALANGLILMAEKERAALAQAGESARQKLRDNLIPLTDQLGKLLDLVLQGHLTQSEYAERKAQLVNEKKEIENKLAAFARQGANRFEPELELYREAVHVGELAESGNAEENREKLKKIGSNFRIGRRRLSVEYKKPWEFILNFNSARAENLIFSEEFLKSKKVRRGRDSNP
ncbi:MAG: recombinase family protein [Elusimicrobiota bacterium]|nr:recombinase family protein [Elusimicrobiota bacterium]